MKTMKSTFKKFICANAKERIWTSEKDILRLALIFKTRKTGEKIAFITYGKLVLEFLLLQKIQKFAWWFSFVRQNSVWLWALYDIKAQGMSILFVYKCVNQLTASLCLQCCWRTYKRAMISSSDVESQCWSTWRRPNVLQLFTNKAKQKQNVLLIRQNKDHMSYYQWLR